MNDQPIRRTYDDGFKRRAVRRHTEGGMSLSAAARDAGVTKGMLHKWVAKFGTRPGAPSLSPASTDQEIRELREEIDGMKKEIAMLREIVSKALSDRHLGS